MEVKVNLPFQELLILVRQLSPTEKAILQHELSTESQASTKPNRLTNLLLTGPTLTDEQLNTLQDTRQSLNQWQTKPL